MLNGNSIVKIKVLADAYDTSLITDSLSELNSSNYEAVKETWNTLNVDRDDIVIAQLTRKESRLFNKLLKLKEDMPNNFLFVLRDENAGIAANIARSGFDQIFVFPADRQEFQALIKELITQYSNKLTSKFSFIDKGNYYFSSIIGKSEKALEMISLAKKVAQTPGVNLMILGETGTGKGVLAKAIHDYGSKVSGQFVDVVCSAIPENLLEAELFGYEKGSFTGASDFKQGLFEIAENGTLFLDEIGDLGLTLQAKLLRVVEKKVIRRIGGVQDIPVNARIISATNRNIQDAVENNLFRRDLFYRLNTVTLKIPPMRDRGDDILHLTEHFIIEFSEMMNKPIHKIEREVLKFLIQYPWLGNIRELRNSVERAVVLADDNVIKLKYFENLFLHITENNGNGSFLADTAATSPDHIGLNLKYDSFELSEVNKIYAQEVLNRSNGNKSKTSKILGISRPTLDKILSSSN